MCELDLSWTEEHNRTLNGGITYSSEPMSELRVQLFYTNSQNELCHSLYETIPLQNSTLPENKLMQLIHTHREYNNTRYACDNIIQYYISIEPRVLIQEIENETFSLKPFEQVQSFHIPKDVVFPNTLFVFHSINTIWIHFRELTLINEPKHTQSILRQPSSNMQSSNVKKFKHTKRVRINEQQPCNKTRKSLTKDI